MKRFLTLAAAALVFAGCSKKDDPPPTSPPAASTVGTVQFRFQPMVGSEPLVLRTKGYKNEYGDSFYVDVHKYFVSNFSLTKSDGAEVKLPQSYFLVDADSLRTVSISSVPNGTYTKLSFLVGVDSARNVSGAQTGDLNPAGRATGMFWDWNTGYIMAKMEGRSLQSPSGNVAFHIGTFTGRNSALRRVTLDLPSSLTVASGTTPTLQIQSDLGIWFTGTPVISFATTNAVMSASATSSQIADNYARGYKVVRIDP